jgi:hypothetical protein
MKTARGDSRWDHEVRLLSWLAVCVSVLSFLYYYRHAEILLYGDAVAHINIARRIFDSKTPGLLQLGTVWLPLPHLLILPFVVSESLWQSGTGASLPSMVAFVLGVVGIFRLTRETMQAAGASDGATRIAGWGAALLYGANPNLDYLQSTAMGEALYMALFIWAVVYFAEFIGSDNKALMKCGWCLIAACLTRYDGWFLAAALIVAVVIATLGFKRGGQGDSVAATAREHNALAKFVVMAVAAPVLWLVYNAAVYRNPIEFANGPYSAKAIEQETHTLNPAKDKALTGSSYFVKAAELNVGEQRWQEKIWLTLAVLGAFVVLFGRGGRAVLLLWLPLPFYAYSVAYASVTIFVPTRVPFSSYNLRYGLELLPAFCVFVPLALWFAAKKIAGLISRRETSERTNTRVGATVLVLILFLAADCYITMWRDAPPCYREAAINSRTRIALETEVGRVLQELPPQSTLLMYLGNHVGALQRAGIPLRRVINEGNHRLWKRPSDPEGLWERALADPRAYADYVVAFEGDRVWQAVADDHLTELLQIHTAGQPRAVIFLARSR